MTEFVFILDRSGSMAGLEQTRHHRGIQCHACKAAQRTGRSSGIYSVV